jgi:hypothetical protein
MTVTQCIRVFSCGPPDLSGGERVRNIELKGIVSGLLAMLQQVCHKGNERKISHLVLACFTGTKKRCVLPYALITSSNIQGGPEK